MTRTATPSSEFSSAPTLDARMWPAFWILLLTVVAVTLGMAPSLQYFDVTPKLIALAAGACLVWIALAAANRLPAPQGEQKAFFRLLWALAVVAMLATVFSRDAVLSLAGTEGRRLGLPALLATLAIAAAVPSVAGSDPRRRRLFIAGIVLAGVAVAVYGMAQYFGIDPWIDPSLYRIGGGESLLIRPPSTLGHGNFFAIFLLLALFSAVGLGLSTEEKQGRWGWAAAAVTIGLGIVSSGSRAGWLGAAVGAAVLLRRAFERRAGEQSSAGHRAVERRAVMTGLAATAALGLAFFVSPWGQPLRNRIVLDDPGITARFLVWRDTLGLLAADPLLGSGPDTFELAFAQRASHELARLAPDQYAESPHNVFLEAFVAGGLPGGLLSLALMLLALRAYGRASSSETSSSIPPAIPRALQRGLLAALVAGLTAAQFSGETMATRLGLLTFASLSLSVPLAPARRADRGMAGGLGVACLAVTIVFGSRMAQADRALFEARESASRGNIAAALEQGRRAREVFPWTGAHSFAFSRMLGQLLAGSEPSAGQRAELLEAAEEAARAGMLHVSQPQAVLVHRASIEVLQGREQEAVQSLESAIAEAPSWYRPRWLLAVLLAGRGELRRAAEQAGAALDLGAQVHPEIADSCRRILDLARVEEGDAGAREIIPLSYDEGTVEPSGTRPDSPNGRWAFPYTDNSFVTLPESTVTFRVNVPAEARFLTTVRMPLPGADPARAVVRINGEELFSESATPQTGIILDLSRYAGQSVALQLGAVPMPPGQTAAWVQWLSPRIVVGAAR